MATKPSTTKQGTTARKPGRTYAQVTGTVRQPVTAYRALRQAKGYGRVALAKALGITPTALWRLENGPANPQAMAALKALPQGPGQYPQRSK